MSNPPEPTSTATSASPGGPPPAAGDATNKAGGDERMRSRYSWGLLIIFSLFGLVCHVGTLLLIYIGVLKNHDAARNVITIVFTVGTLSLAIILVLAVLLLNDENAISRFQRGKEVLTILVGILGTIIGFYFGSNVADKPAPPQEVSDQAVDPGRQAE